METVSTRKKNVGGRPKKTDKQDQFIGVKCTLHEKEILKEKARLSHQSLSEFLRETGLQRHSPKIKTLPLEVLQLTGQLNHLAANINQIARKVNQFGFLSTQEKTSLQKLSDEVKQLAILIKNYLI